MSELKIPLMRKLWIRIKIWLTEKWSSFVMCIRTAITFVRQLSLKKILRDARGEFFACIVLPLYPFLLFSVLLYYMTSTSQAGAIRHAEATEDKPTIVRIAKGRRTAIHFWQKPDRVIAGSPGKIQIDFLANDVTVSPLANDPGNLLVYARGMRFVILFQMVTANGYDDVVDLVPGKSKTLRPIRLNEDSYKVANFKIVSEASGRRSETTEQAILKNGETVAVFENLPDFKEMKSIQCGKCQFLKNDTTFVCPTAIAKIECRGSSAFSFSAQKVAE